MTRTPGVVKSEQTTRPSMVTEESTNSLHRCIYCKPSIPPRLVNDINLLTAGEANKHLESTSSHMVDISATHLLVCQKVACTNNALKCLATDHCQGSFTRAPWLKQLATRAMDLTSFGSVRFVWFSQVKRFKWIGPSSVCFVNGPGVCVCVYVCLCLCVCVPLIITALYSSLTCPRPTRLFCSMCALLSLVASNAFGRTNHHFDHFPKLGLTVRQREHVPAWKLAKETWEAFDRRV